MAEPIEEDVQTRLARAEQKITDLERLSREQAAQIVDLLAKNRTQAEIDNAMLARIDGFIESQNRVERRQIAGFDALMAGQKSMEAALAALVDIAKDHKTAIDTLANEQRIQRQQQQEILRLVAGGRPPLND